MMHSPSAPSPSQPFSLSSLSSLSFSPFSSSSSSASASFPPIPSEAIAWAASLLTPDDPALPPLPVPPAFPELPDLLPTPCEELFQIEREWRRLVLSHQDELVCLLSPSGMFVKVSELAHQITGFRADELVGLNVVHLVHINDLPLFYDELNQAANEGKVVVVSHRFRKRAFSQSYVLLESTMSLCLLENNVIGETPCIMMHSKVITDLEVPSSPPKISSQDLELIEALRNEVKALREQLGMKCGELEALRQEMTGHHFDGENKKRRRDKAILKCEECGTQDSPEWRRGPSGAQSLCNACGLRYSKRMRQQQALICVKEEPISSVS